MDFEWISLDPTCDQDLNMIHKLLLDNYIENSTSTFKSNYTIPFLRWALSPPGWRIDWTIGIKDSVTCELIAFINATPVNLNIDQITRKSAGINFLCVHKKFRCKRMAPLLIQEITHRLTMCKINNAMYTTGVKLPGSVSVCRYYHKTLNFKKLTDTGLFSGGNQITYQQNITTNQQIQLRPLESRDIQQSLKLLNDYLIRYDLHPVFTEEEFIHHFVPIQDVIMSFVIESTSGVITDFISFYNIPMTVCKAGVDLKVAYLYYYATTASDISSRLKILVNEAIITATRSSFDIFNCLMSMDNETFINHLNFEMGDGCLRYYLRGSSGCPISKNIPGNKIGMSIL